jgi:hypothetical protein
MAINITYSKFMFVALVNQHAKRMRRVILPSVFFSGTTIFPHFSHKTHNFRGESLFDINLVFWLSLKLLFWIISHCQTPSHLKYQFFLRFGRKSKLGYRFSRDPQILCSLIRASQYDSAEIPTKCSFVIEFIIPKFIEGSTCFERHIAHYQEL